MWYTPVSGIWQTVWLEPVPKNYIHGLHIVTGETWADIHVDGPQNGFVEFENRGYPLKEGRARIELTEPVLWSPEKPHLYEFTVTCGEDRVESYFALRTLSIQTVNGKQRLCLNGEPYFFLPSGVKEENTENTPGEGISYQTMQSANIASLHFFSSDAEKGIEYVHTSKDNKAPGEVYMFDENFKQIYHGKESS